MSRIGHGSIAHGGVGVLYAPPTMLMDMPLPEMHTELSLARRRIAELEAQLAAAVSYGPAASSSFEAMRLREVEGQLVRGAMQRARGNVSCAARALGLSRPALYRRLERHGLTRTGDVIR